MNTTYFLWSRNLTILFVFFQCFVSVGQENQLKISPKWKVGESRKAHVDQSIRVIFDDSIVKNQQKSYDVVIKVSAVKSNFYVIKWSCKNDNEILQYYHHRSAPDPNENRIIDALKSAEKKVLYMNLTLQMDKNTGEIKEWLNGRELLKNAEFQEKQNIKKWCASKNVPDEDRINMELDFSKKLNAAYEIWHEMLLQKANFFFESYKQNFLMNKTLKEDVLTTDILDLLDDKTKFPGKMTKEATEINDRLILDKKIEYEKEFLTLYLRKMDDSFNNLSSKDVMVFEKEQSIFDLKSTWLVNYSKKLYFEVRGMKTTSTSTVTFL